MKSAIEQERTPREALQKLIDPHALVRETRSLRTGVNRTERSPDEEVPASF